jgi:hypothetical protein
MEPTPRDILIDRVRRGEITPDEAEEEAAREGLRPLARVPAAKFYPMVEAFWSLPMAVAWIAWRNVDRVRDFWDAFRADCWEWVPVEWRVGVDGPTYSGFDLRRRDAVTPLFVETSDILEADGFMTVKEAKAMLWRLLGEGALQATGIKTESGQSEVIPEHAWVHLDWRERRGTEGVRLAYTGPGAGGYDNVRVRADAVAKIWPPTSPRIEGLPETVPPSGRPYMPLSQAAQWIATSGGTGVVLPTDTVGWETAYGELIARIAAGEVEVIGMRDGKNEKLDAVLFVGIRVAPPFLEVPVSLALSAELYLLSFEYVDDEHWRYGFDDSLRDRFGTKWSRLMARTSDVASLWPFGLDSARDVSTRSDGPGRPTSMPDVIKEFLSRCDRGAVEKTTAGEARVLSAWLAKTHPKEPQLKPKAISNYLSVHYPDRFKTARN